MFCGRNIKDYMEFIYALANLLTKMSNIKVRVVDMLDIFKVPILDIKLFNEKIDVVFAALEKDAMVRKETQDYAVNIIIKVQN